MATDSDRIHRVAEELGMAVDEETVDHVVTAANELEASAETLIEASAEVDDEGVPGDDDFNAYLTTYPDPRQETRQGPLAGLTVAVKDNVAVRGLEMTCGSQQFSVVPPEDATLVRRLLDAGATITGKTNMDVFAFGPSGEFSEFGRVVNPIDVDRVPGGSSAGSGAAVAAKLVDVAIGSDTGGSIRMPAACCGIVGAKPSHRLVPRDGFVDFAPTLDTVGPLAKDVQSAADTLEVIAGHTHRDPSSSRLEPPSFGGDLATDPADLTIGLPGEFLEVSADSVAESVQAVADDLVAAGATVREVSIDLGEIQNAYFLTAATEFAWFYRQAGVIRGQGTGYDEWLRAALVDQQRSGLDSQHVAWRVLPAAYLDDVLSGRAYAAARREVARFEEALETAFAEVEVLLTPTIRDLPPKYDRMSSQTELMNLLGNTAPFNLTGMPGVSVPIAEVKGLPVSAQLVAPVFADERALQAAAVVESIADVTF